ncbi:MAG TPA: sulfur carrier protein ThiS [Armatimonadota bacterium]
MITLTLNGELRSLPQQQTVLDFLSERDLQPRFVVVEHNGSVLSRDRFGEVLLSEGDVVEIVHMMGGG